MPTKDELMKWMKTYKKENCKAISTMNKNQLYTEAKKHGFLYEKFGIKNKTKAPMSPKASSSVNINDFFPTTASAPAPKASAPAPKASAKVTKEQLDKLQKEIDNLLKSSEAVSKDKKNISANTKKNIIKVKSLRDERLALLKEYKKQQKA